MELYVEARVFYQEFEYRMNLNPSSKCALLLCKYPNELKNVIVNIVLSDRDYSLLTSDQLSNYENHLKLLGYNAKLINYFNLPKDFKLVDLPLTLRTGKHLIYCGPAAVFRSLVQFNYQSGEKISVFGNSQSCLKACKEKSKWTLMCEKTVIDLISSYIYDRKSFNESVLLDLSASFKIHKNQMNNSKKNFHPFLEGPRKSLTDIVIAFYLLEYSLIDGEFLSIVLKYEHINDWLCLMKRDRLEEIIDSLNFLPICWLLMESRLQTNHSHTFSIADGLQKMNISAKNVTDLRNIVSDKDINEFKMNVNDMRDLNFDWNDVPLPLRPNNSQIPEFRQMKKTDQLLNMVKCASRLVKPGMTIVDFCSGGGHLGLIMAAIHRDCHVVLLENKEESLSMAEERIDQSNLSNIKLYKCNIFAFKGDFDIGMALHACGSVTDLVVEICLTKNAHMIISPCCYGSIAPSVNVTYPRSDKFKEVSLEIYSKLCHAADCFNAPQTRTLLGNEAMKLIDSDRSYHVAQNNYSTEIFKMIPHDCTPKNHILFFTKAN